MCQTHFLLRPNAISSADLSGASYVSIASIAVSATLRSYGIWVLAMTAIRLVDRAWNDHAAAGRESLEA